MKGRQLPRLIKPSTEENTVLEEERLKNIAEAQAYEKEYEENSVVIEKYYHNGAATSKASNPKGQKLAFGNMRNDTTKRSCKKEGAQALAHPEVVPGTCRKVQPRNTRAGRPKHTAKTTGSTNSSNQMTQRQPSVKGVEYSAPQTVRSVALGGEQQQLNSQPSKTIINRLQPHTLSSSESSAPIRASQSPVYC
jgi:hypothetical protein